MHQEQPRLHLMLVSSPVHPHLDSSQPAPPSLYAEVNAGRRPSLLKSKLKASSPSPRQRSQRNYKPHSPQVAILSVFPLSPDLPPQRNTGTRARSTKDTPGAKGTRRRRARSVLWPSHLSAISWSVRRSDALMSLVPICIEHVAMSYRAGSNSPSRIPEDAGSLIGFVRDQAFHSPRFRVIVGA